MIKKDQINKDIKELENIADWFENTKELDITKAMLKVERGATLIKGLKAHLKGVENRFEEIKKEVTKD